PDVSWFQQQLQRLGYTTPQNGTLDRATINVLAAFQMHYRPALHDGQPDAETAAIMLAML
ncbi:peptidoglycan-binding domain-containing protein, partial [Levilactobacillus namurensis]